MNEICFMSAVEMARAIRTGELSAREALDAHLRQIERLNPRLNAIVTLTSGTGMEQAKRADESLAGGQLLGALHGLPAVFKDLHDTAGVRTTYGSPIFADNVPEQDAIDVERIKAAGAIMLGKTNTPEFGAGSQTFNAVFGATRNPYDPTKTCGGSSGGAAVALACGMAPIADGSDMGGSLRNPASFCNVVGLRPAPGRVPHQSPFQAWSPLSVAGPMGRCVEDVALLLSVMAGPDERSPISIEESGSRFSRPLERDVRGTRVAWAEASIGIPFDSRTRAALEPARGTLESLGCVVEEASPDFSGAREAFQTLRALAFAAQYGGLAKTHRHMIKATVIGEVERGGTLTGMQIGRAETLRSALYHRLREFFQRYDFLVLPTTQVPPFELELEYVTEIGGTKMESYIDWMESCSFISITGYPAISIPGGFTAGGLPAGLQIVGRRQGEWSILELAYAFEQATGWGKRRPPLVLEGGTGKPSSHP